MFRKCSKSVTFVKCRWYFIFLAAWISYSNFELEDDRMGSGVGQCVYWSIFNLSLGCTSTVYNYNIWTFTTWCRSMHYIYLWLYLPFDFFFIVFFFFFFFAGKNFSKHYAKICQRIWRDWFCDFLQQEISEEDA
jgi:hypothetical protein